MITGWKITYSDGSTFTDKDGTWERAPSEGVQFVTVYFQEDDGTKHKIVHRKFDYYWFHDGIFGRGGLTDIERFGVPPESVKLGRQLPDDVYQTMEAKEMADAP